VKLGSDIPVTRKVKRESLAVTLHILLEPLGLDWVVERGVVTITTRDIVAKRHPEVVKLQQALPNLKQVVVQLVAPRENRPRGGIAPGPRRS